MLDNCPVEWEVWVLQFWALPDLWVKMAEAILQPEVGSHLLSPRGSGFSSSESGEKLLRGHQAPHCGRLPQQLLLGVLHVLGERELLLGPV